MAGETGPAPDPVAALQALLEQPESFDFFEALRRIECAWPSLPRLGTAARPADEPVRLGQAPSLAFAPSMLASAEAIGDGTAADPRPISSGFSVRMARCRCT